MAVVPRKRKSGIVYYAVNLWRGKQAAELVGTSRRDAEIRDRAMKREIAAGTYQPPASVVKPIVGPYSVAWGEPRRNPSADDERRSIRLYLLPYEPLANKRLDEVKPADVDAWVDWLETLTVQKNGITKRRLSEKTIAKAAGVLSLVFDRAVKAELCTKNPVMLDRGRLSKQPAVEREPYTVGETIVLTRHHLIPWPIRVLNSLCLLAGMREGEACGRRWKDLDDAPRPLPSLTIRDQYDALPLKTKKPRVVPVHRELQRILAEWATEGFELYTGRKPQPDDLIVPTMTDERRWLSLARNTYYRAFVRSAKAAGVRVRTLHAMRHTFITLCRRGGARAEIIERVTHNAKGKMVDRYTHWDWEPLCEAVACLNLDVHPSAQGEGGNGGEFTAGDKGRVHRFLGQNPDAPADHQAHSRGAGLGKRRKHRTLLASRQGSIQDFEANLAERRRRRKAELLALAVADPKAAAPGLAACRALDAVLARDRDGAVRHLATMAQAVGSVPMASDRRLTRRTGGRQ